MYSLCRVFRKEFAAQGASITSAGTVLVVKLRDSTRFEVDWSASVSNEFAGEVVHNSEHHIQSTIEHNLTRVRACWLGDGKFEHDIRS